jgi:hypothetical protein
MLFLLPCEEKIEIRGGYKDMCATMNHIQVKHAWALPQPILEKTLIEAVSENNIVDVQTLLNNVINEEEIGPAILMATSMGYSEIVEELVWAKYNNGHKCGLRPGVNRTDVVSAIRTAKINKENASDKKIWTDIIYNLSWGLVQIIEDGNRANN